MDFYKGTIPILDDEPAAKALWEPGDEYGKGYVERDYNEYPESMFQQPNEMDLFDPSEWDALYDEQEKLECSLEHIYLRGGKPAFVNLDQGSWGYCWAYSTGHALMMSMLADHRPLTRLNPHSVASIIKRGANEGGWCGLSAEKVGEIGMAPEGNGPGEWPLQSGDYQRYYTDECKKRMADFKITEDWCDLTRQVYNRSLTEKQLATACFNNTPCPTDFNHWSHSVCTIRWVRIERGSWGGLILNSWKGWGRFGLGVLRGSKAIPNGAIGVRNVGRRALQSLLAT